jgi:phage shock protein PspC (stress-responsive transcriptional regulator)
MLRPMADPLSPPPSPTQGHHAGPRKLVRRPDDGMVAGVCAGVAEYFDLDPVIVRLGAVALLFSGIGFVLYPAAWIFVPASDGHAYVDTTRPANGDRHRQVAAVGLIVIALCIIAGGWWWLPRHWLLPLGLIGAGAFLLARRDKDDHPAPPPPAPPVPPYDAPRAAPGAWPGNPPTSVVPAPPAPAGATEAPTSGVATADAATGSADGDAATGSGDSDSDSDSTVAGGDDDAEGDPAMADEHDPDHPTTPSGATPTGAYWTAGAAATAVDDAPAGGATSVFGPDAGDAGGQQPPDGDPFHTRELPFPPVPPDVAGHHRRRGRFVSPLVFGALLMWGGAAWLGGVELPTALAVGLLILGSGFVLGAFVGGSKALIAPALVIGALLVVASIADIPWDSGIGERHWEPHDVRHLHRSYRLAIGEGTLDLSDLDLAAGTIHHVDAKVGIGHLRVVVPEGVQLDITGHNGAGDVQLLGKEDDGFQVDVDRTVEGSDSQGRLDLDLEVGMGDLEVVRAA